jgi:hypothetical protein
MRGSLDEPPVLIQQDREKLCLMLAGSLALGLAIGLLTWSSVGKTLFWGYMASGLFVVLSIGLIARIVRPGYLLLTPHELTCRTIFRIDCYSWNDFASFAVWAPRSFIREPAYFLSDTSPKWQRSRKLLAGATGGIVSFGGGWEEDATEIVDLLEKARARWATI